MIKNYLIDNTELQDEKSRSLILDYFLVEETRTEEEEVKFLYGIQITKKMVVNGVLQQEQEMTPALSCSRIFVEKMIHKLINGTVTPMGLIEVVDDLIGEDLMSA